MKNSKHFYHYLLLMAMCMSLSIGCASNGMMEKKIPMNSPEHHVLIGEQFLSSQNPDQAAQEFEAALAMDPEYSPAMAGMARLYALQGDSEQAIESAGKAIESAQDQTEETNARLAMMEVLTKTGEPKDIDIDEIEDEFDDIMDISPENEESMLLMSRAYFMTGDTENIELATELYGKIVEADGPMSVQAEQEWKKMQTRQRLESDVRATEELADLKELTRAQAAALVVEELEGCALIEKRKAAKAEYGFKTPSQDRLVKQSEATGIPADVVDHPLNQTVGLALSLDLRGLSNRPDGLFYPDAPMTRANMAMVLEDLLIIADENESLSRKFVGNTSPFIDVQTESYAFNAISLVVSRDLMHAEKNNRFFPDKAVSGMTALRSTQQVKAMMK